MGWIGGRCGLTVATEDFGMLRAVRWLIFLVFAAGCSLSGQHLESPGDRLLWSDEFDAARTAPDPAHWTYETGGGGWGNAELEVYCSLFTTDPPCRPAELPNVFIDGEGVLHLVARRDEQGQWTSARLVTRGLESFRYGRVEARIRVPRGQGVWPAFWMLGEDVQEHPWPLCGEMDIMENIGKEPGVVHGSVHGAGFAGAVLTKSNTLPAGQAFADAFHVFGMLWSPGKVQFYVDDPAKPYATYTPAMMPKGSVWPFDGRRFSILLSLAIGGSWPGSPDVTTMPVQDMQVDYVRVYGDPSGP